MEEKEELIGTGESPLIILAKIEKERDEAELKQQWNEKIHVQQEGLRKVDMTGIDTTSGEDVLIQLQGREFGKVLNIIGSDKGIQERMKENGGSILYGDSETIATDIYGHDFVKSEKNGINGVYTEEEITKELVTKMLNPDIFVEDRRDIPKKDKYTYFLLSLGYDKFRKSNTYIMHKIGKKAKIEENYTLLQDKTGKFGFPTYKQKPYFGIQF